MPLHMTAARITAGVLLAANLVSPVFAATGTVDTEGSKLRMREQASTSSSVLKKLSHGTQVEVLDSTENGWYQISYKGLTGYVSGDYLIVTEDTPAEPSASAPASETPSQDIPSQDIPSQDIQPETPALESGTGYIKVTTSVLNIRSGPGTSYEKTGKVRAGKILAVLEKLDGWYKVEEGYVSADYVMETNVSALEAASKGQEIADYALSFVGCAYVYGGSTPKGFDCSGLTKYVYKQFGYTINRTASNQLDNGVAVGFDELEPGDLVMFKKAGTGSSRASHVGIYIGNRQFVHASSPKVGVIVSNLSDAYYTTGFVGARRIV